MNHKDIANYSDDNTPYVFGKNIDEVVIFLEEFSRVIFKWFSDNQFQANLSVSDYYGLTAKKSAKADEMADRCSQEIPKHCVAVYC